MTSIWLRYIARFKNLKDKIIQDEGKGKSNLKLVSIVLNNISPTSKYFSLIFYTIPLFFKGHLTPILEEFSLI